MSPRDIAFHRQLLALCAEAYNAPADLKAGDAFVTVRKIPGGWVYAWRGSHSVEDWLTDFRVNEAPSPELGCAVHAGFGADLSALYPLLAADLAARTGDIWFGGHSKGGADAILNAATVRRSGRPLSGLVTFGAPAVTPSLVVGGLLADTCQTHYRSGADVVPTLPPFWQHPTALTPIGHDWRPIEAHLIQASDSALQELSP